MRNLLECPWVRYVSRPGRADRHPRGEPLARGIKSTEVRLKRPRKRVGNRKGKRPRKASKSPGKEAKTPGSTGSEGITSKSRLTGEQIEQIEKLAVMALSAVEPVAKLIEMLIHLR